MYQNSFRVMSRIGKLPAICEASSSIHHNLSPSRRCPREYLRRCSILPLADRSRNSSYSIPMLLNNESRLTLESEFCGSPPLIGEGRGGYETFAIDSPSLLLYAFGIPTGGIARATPELLTSLAAGAYVHWAIANTALFTNKCLLILTKGDNSDFRRLACQKNLGAFGRGCTSCQHIVQQQNLGVVPVTKAFKYSLNCLSAFKAAHRLVVFDFTHTLESIEYDLGVIQ